MTKPPAKPPVKPAKRPLSAAAVARIKGKPSAAQTAARLKRLRKANYPV